jgi:hypothetical protein
MLIANEITIQLGADNRPYLVIVPVTVAGVDPGARDVILKVTVVDPGTSVSAAATSEIVPPAEVSNGEAGTSENR